MSHFTQENKQRIVDAIREAELNTSGEIRVHIENKCSGEVLDRAVDLFHKLKMEQTRQRNGVLLYVAMKSHKVAIIGDEGVNAVVPDDFWNGIIDRAVKQFAQGQYAEGIAEAVTAVGEVLKQHFPYRNDDINELPDEISFGEE